jgi:maltose phosphorylase
MKVSDNMYFSEEHNVYLQQDGTRAGTRCHLDKSQDNSTKNGLGTAFYVLLHQTSRCVTVFHFFEDHFSKEELKNNFEFYESFTVHESSLSPCVHPSKPHC